MAVNPAMNKIDVANASTTVMVIDWSADNTTTVATEPQSGP
jgi:hypothetical protein